MKLRFFNKIDIHIKKVRKTHEWYHQDYIKFKSLLGENSDFPIANNFPCLNDKNDNSGIISGHYFHQDLFVAKKIFQSHPTKHVDIGSRIDGFIAHVAVSRPIEIIDIRALTSKVENITFTQADLMSDDLPLRDYCDSISSLHALEHFGLGRYGDTIDPNGHIKGFMNITKILQQGGIFYFSVPIGVQRIEFNAHRVFNLTYLLNWITKYYSIQSFSYIDDVGDFHQDVPLTGSIVESTCGCNYGCGIFILIKK